MTINAMPTFVEQRLIHIPGTNKCEVKDFFVYHTKEVMQKNWDAPYNGLEGYRELTENEKAFFSRNVIIKKNSDLGHRTNNAIEQLMRHSNGVESEDIINLLELITDINDEVINGRGKEFKTLVIECFRDTLNKVKKCFN